MYYELGHFIKKVACQKSILKDGELWTSVMGGVAFGIWIHFDPSIASATKDHFGDILTVASIIFGFVLATLIFYVQAASEWSADKRVRKVAELIVDWHVWTVLWFLLLIGYTVALWMTNRFITKSLCITSVAFGLLAFQGLYCALQILNHTLTVWWVFRNTERLALQNSDMKPTEANQDGKEDEK